MAKKNKHIYVYIIIGQISFNYQSRLQCDNPPRLLQN